MSNGCSGRSEYFSYPSGDLVKGTRRSIFDWYSPSPSTIYHRGLQKQRALVCPDSFNSWLCLAKSHRAELAFLHNALSELSNPRLTSEDSAHNHIIMLLKAHKGRDSVSCLLKSPLVPSTSFTSIVSQSQFYGFQSNFPTLSAFKVAIGTDSKSPKFSELNSDRQTQKNHY